MINVIREFGSSFREVPFSRIQEEEDVPPTPTSPSVIEFFNSRKNHVSEPFTVTLTNTFYTGTVPPGKPTFLPRPTDTPLRRQWRQCHQHRKKPSSPRNNAVRYYETWINSSR